MNKQMWIFRGKRDHIRPETLSEYLDGRLSQREHSKVERHLEGCSLCARELRSIQYTVGLLRRAPVASSRRSFTMAGEPLTTPPRHLLKAPAWAYGAVASVAVLFFAVVLSADATGLLAGDASGPDLPQQTGKPLPPASGPDAGLQEDTGAGTSTPRPSPAPRPQIEASTSSDGDTEKAPSAAAPAPVDVTAEAESAVRTAPMTEAPAAPTEAQEAATAPDATPISAAARPPTPLPSELEPAPSAPSAAAPEVLETDGAEDTGGGTATIWRVLEGVSGAVALLFATWALWRVWNSRRRATF